MPGFQPSEYDVWLLPRPIAWAEIWRPCRPQNKTKQIICHFEHTDEIERNFMGQVVRNLLDCSANIDGILHYLPHQRCHFERSEKSIETWLVLYTDSSLRSEWQGMTGTDVLQPTLPLPIFLSHTMSARSEIGLLCFLFGGKENPIAPVQSLARSTGEGSVNLLSFIAPKKDCFVFE